MNTNPIISLVEELYLDRDRNFELLKAQVRSIAKTIWIKEKAISIEDAYTEVEKQVALYLRDLREDFYNAYFENRLIINEKYQITTKLLNIIRQLQEELKQKEVTKLIRDLSIKDTANIIVELGKEVLKILTDIKKA